MRQGPRGRSRRDPLGECPRDGGGKSCLAGVPPIRVPTLVHPEQHTDRELRPGPECGDIRDQRRRSAQRGLLRFGRKRKAECQKRGQREEKSKMAHRVRPDDLSPLEEKRQMVGKSAPSCKPRGGAESNEAAQGPPRAGRVGHCSDYFCLLSGSWMKSRFHRFRMRKIR